MKNFFRFTGTLVLGMGVQAIIVSALTALKVVEPTLAQQLTTAVILFAIARP